MKKNLMFGSIVTAVMLLGTGCGGGSSSSDSNTEDSANSSSNTQKTGYYLDSAVGGVEYKCVDSNSNAQEDENAQGDEDNQTDEGNTSTEGNGEENSDNNTSSGEGEESSEGNTSAEGDSNTSATNKMTRLMFKTNSGTTNADGSFSYKEGQVCTFSVGGIVLREIDTATMGDNIVFEDDVETAKFLQTLDNDGNPENGIQIDAEVSNAIASGKVDLQGTIPQSDEEITKLVAQLQDEVDSYKGEATGEAEAQSHLDDTRSAIEAMNGHMSASAETEGSAEGNGETSNPMNHVGDAPQNNEGTKNPTPNNNPIDEMNRFGNSDDSQSEEGNATSEGRGSNETSGEGSATGEASSSETHNNLPSPQTGGFRSN